MTNAQKATVLILTLAVTLVFVSMIRGFLAALFLAAVFSALAQPLYGRLVRLFRGRESPAAACTILIVTLIIVLPLAALLIVVAGQAIELSESLLPWLQDRVKNISQNGLKLPDWVPGHDHVEDFTPQLTGKLSELASKFGGYLMSTLSGAAQVTAGLALNAFILLYAMFSFLKDGAAIRDRILANLPLADDVKQRLVEKGMSVTRATIKGTLVIGIVQGALGGIALAVVGIEGAAFWGMVMAVSSVIPAVGTALVWVPAVVYLLATGQWTAGIGLALWCALVVGTVDNVLRPRLVGNDTQMPDLLILLGTLGGLAAFGVLGLLIGPIIAALLVTMWDVFGVTFQEMLAVPEKEERQPTENTSAEPQSKKTHHGDTEGHSAAEPQREEEKEH